MTTPSEALVSQLAWAAHLRVAGHSCEAVARELGLSLPEYWRRLHDYQPLWRRLYNAAEDLLTERLGAEAEVILSELAESAEAEAIRRKAARTLERYFKPTGPVGGP